MAWLVKWSYSEICEKVYKHFPKKSHGSFSQILQTKKGLQTPLITSILKRSLGNDQITGDEYLENIRSYLQDMINDPLKIQ